MIQGENLLGLDDILYNDNLRLDSLFNNHNNIEDENIVSDSPYENCFINCNYYDEDDFINNFKNSKLSSILSHNVQGINSKFNNFREFLNNLKSQNFSFSIIGLQEIHSVIDRECLNIDGYHDLIFKSRSQSRGGGLGFYISSHIKFKILNDISVFHEKIFESIFLELQFPDNTKLIVGNVYRSPSRPLFLILLKQSN